MNRHLNTSDVMGMAQALGLRRHGDEWRGDCPACGYGGEAFALLIRADGSPRYYCHAGCDFPSLKAALDHRGILIERKSAYPKYGVATGATPAIDSPGHKIVATNACYGLLPLQAVQEIWSKTYPIEGTIGEQYLRQRGLVGPYPDAIRFAPRCWHKEGKQHCPAVVSAVSDLTGRIQAVHRTYLDATTGKKASIIPNKKTLGIVQGNAIQYDLSQPIMGIGEGPESTLSARQLYGLPVWSAVNAGNLVTLRLPPVEVVSEVRIFADADSVGLRRAYAAAEKWSRQGRRVWVERPTKTGMDYNDLLMGGEG